LVALVLVVLGLATGFALEVGVFPATALFVVDLGLADEEGLVPETGAAARGDARVEDISWIKNKC